MAKTKIIICLAGFVLLLGACGIVPRKGSVPGKGGSNPTLAAVSSFDEIEASLEQAHRDWKGTPYVLGGRSQKGVDCSSFVKIVFDQYFGIELPPNTTTQINAGTGIRRRALRTGDLVFFRTGRRTMHVGIIVEDDEFLHASTSKGVMISALSEHYWSSRYLASRRVFE
ncbi:MAG: NlpC/P60 family protein [Balneolaceae bacterium]|nr:NlpC/P60 family protein [Balneolaceae bacterium]